MNDHNNSELNGFIEKEQARSYGEWLTKVLGKTSPETATDFVLLNQALADMVDAMLHSLEHFVEIVAACPNKASVIEDWITRTLEWYCKNVKMEIYKGQIMDAYIVNARLKGRSRPEFSTIGTLTYNIGKWIEAAFYAPIDLKLKEAEDAIKTNQQVLECATPIAQAMRKKLPEKDWAAAEASFRL